MPKFFALTKKVPVYGTADVVIIGGGPSGIGAAIAASRCGKKVILVEQSAQLGGMATLGNVAIFMWTGNFTGIFREIWEEICPGKINKKGRPDPPQFDPFRLRLYLNEKLAAEKVTVLYHTSFISCLKKKDTVTAIAVNTRQGLQAIEGGIFIDCTGDARVAIDAGARYTSGRPEDGLTQPVTLMFALQDTGKPVARCLPPGCPRYEKVEDLPQGRLLHWQLTGTGTLLVNMTRVKANGAKVEDINYAEREALKQVFGVTDFLQRTEVPNHILSHIAPQTGVRQTHQVKGEYTLTEDDILHARRFKDVVAQTDYGIDIHDPTGGGKCDLRHLDLYDIPYRCMVPRGLDNILVSGRAISADHVTMSSLRVMPTCFALGQAAGVAAAVALEKDCALKAIPIRSLHQILKEQRVEFS